MHVILNLSVLLVERCYFKFPTILCNENGFAFEVAIFQSKISICMQASSRATSLQFNSTILIDVLNTKTSSSFIRRNFSVTNLTVQLHITGCKTSCGRLKVMIAVNHTWEPREK